MPQLPRIWILSRNTTSLFTEELPFKKTHPKWRSSSSSSSRSVWSKWTQKSFSHGSAWMELSAPRARRLWIFCAFLRGDFSTGRSGLPGEREPELLHRPEQRMFWVHQEKNGVLLWHLLSENRRLLRGLPACVPNIWWVAGSYPQFGIN